MLNINLNGKTALVTGCDDPEARRVAELLAEAGADVAVQFEKQDKAVFELCEQIKKDGRRAISISADIRNYNETMNVMEQVIASFGRIDILINDIKLDEQTLLMNLTLEQWNESLHHNLYSVFNVSKCASMFMVKQKAGTVVNITSAASISGLTGGVDHSASEAAIHGMTLAMAKELAVEGIRVNAIAPARDILTSADDFGKLAVYLSSSLADGISGQVFVLNGVLCKRGEQ